MSLAALWPVFEDRWILHDDADIIVIDKPSGMATHPPEPDRVDDAHTRLAIHLGGQTPAYLGIHQRLDAETSGVLLFTRRREANRAVAQQFEGRTVKKTYLAAVEGKIPPKGELRHRLAPGTGGNMVVVPPRTHGGQEALTRYRVIARDHGRSLVELSPETGRTHQLRVQLAAIGAPIAGDTRYGGPPAERLMLHASALTIAHPSGGGERTFNAPRPAAMDAWLAGEACKLDTAEALEERMREAARLRYGLAMDAGTTAFRLVNDAGDGLAGITVDVYGEHLVVALLGDEAIAKRALITEAAHRLGAAGIYVKVRPKHASRIVDARREEYSPSEAERGQSAPEAFTVHERGLPYRVRLGDGLSTGIFLDQRDNRARVRQLAGGGRVLNLFSYTAAFTVAAIAGGARSSVSVDVSHNATEWARDNLALVGASDAHQLVEADVLEWLAAQMRLGDKRPRYDLICLDPPSFSTTKRTRWSAETGYAKVAAQCLALLAPGGRLLACTNHRGISPAKFRHALRDAAREASRELTQLKDLPAPSDFPAPPGQPSHLKSLLATAR